MPDAVVLFEALRDALESGRGSGHRQIPVRLLRVIIFVETIELTPMPLLSLFPLNFRPRVPACFLLHAVDPRPQVLAFFSCTNRPRVVAFFSCTMSTQGTRFFLLHTIDLLRCFFDRYFLLHAVDPWFGRFFLLHDIYPGYSLFSLACVDEGYCTRFIILYAVDNGAAAIKQNIVWVFCDLMRRRSLVLGVADA